MTENLSNNILSIEEIKKALVHAIQSINANIHKDKCLVENIDYGFCYCPVDKLNTNGYINITYHEEKENDTVCFKFNVRIPSNNITPLNIIKT